MFGVGPIQNSLRGTSPPPEMPFTVRGPYCWVRHPLYFCCLVMIWFCPDLSADRLLYNTLWTVWIFVGSVLEERDLVAMFGEIGTTQEERVADLIEKGKFTKPLIAYVGGKAAKSGTRFSHAGAIVEGTRGSYKSKVQRLRSVGVHVVESISEIPKVALKLRESMRR